MALMVCGFDQERVIKFSTDGVSLDHTDLLILRWFADEYPAMRKIVVGNEEYGFVNYQDVLDDYPILGIKKRMLMIRFKKLVDLGVLTHVTVRDNGTYSCYGFGPMYRDIAG